MFAVIENDDGIEIEEFAANFCSICLYAGGCACCHVVFVIDLGIEVVIVSV